MKLIEDNGLKLLVPELDNHVLYNVKSNIYLDKVYLGTADSMENYREIDKSLIPGEKRSMDELLDIINKQDAALTNLAQQLAELAKLVPFNDNKK